MPDTAHTRPEHDEFRRQVARFIAREVEPHAAGWDERGFVPRDVLRRMGALGWLGLTVPAADGGPGADMITNVVFQEALSRSTSGGFVITVLVHTDMASPHLVHGGNAAQKRRWLGGVLAGEVITAVAITEPDAGSDVAAIRTRAVRDDAHYVLNGTKMFITNQQAVRQRLSLLSAKVAAARQFLYHCAWQVDQGLDAVREVSMPKALTGELVNEVTYACQQFHGGAGYMRESPIERLVRDARVLAIGGGATEVMLEEVAKRWEPQ